MGWYERSQGCECNACGARQHLLVVHYVTRRRVWDGGWRVRRFVHARATCIDRTVCGARADKARERGRIRGGLLVIFDAPCPDPPAGACRWCGESIALVKGAGHRHARRIRHRGDQWEVAGSPDCALAFNLSRTWRAHAAVERRDLAERGVIACVDCGTVCQGGDYPYVSWEADHEIALEDGGAHEMDNLRCRCVPCHKAKTARENAARRAVVA